MGAIKLPAFLGVSKKRGEGAKYFFSLKKEKIIAPIAPKL
jgi:hypothetical protein